MKVEGVFETHVIDAMDSDAEAALIRLIDAQIVINVGSPFLNMTVLEACIQTGAAYIDTAVHEQADSVFEKPPWYANYEWKRRNECAKKGVTVILGAGFSSRAGEARE